MKKISIKGVFLGGITDVLTTNILAVPLIIYVMANIDRSHTPKEQLGAARIAALHGSVLLYTVQFLIGAGCSILGGYVAARLAKHDELLNGSLSSYLCMGIGLYSVVAGKESSWLLLELIGLAASPALGLLAATSGLHRNALGDNSPNIAGSCCTGLGNHPDGPRKFHRRPHLSECLHAGICTHQLYSPSLVVTSCAGSSGILYLVFVDPEPLLRSATSCKGDLR